MYRLTQIIRTHYIRIEGFIYQIFRIYLAGSISSISSVSFGFTTSQYLPEDTGSKTS